MKKKKRERKRVHQFFDTFSPATEGAEEEDRNSTGEKNTGRDLNERRVVGGGEKGRSGRKWKFDGAICRVYSGDNIGEVGHPCPGRSCGNRNGAEN